MNKYLEKIAEMHEVNFHHNAHPLGFLAESSTLHLNHPEYAKYVKDKDKAWTGKSMAVSSLANAAVLGGSYGLLGHIIAGSRGAKIGAAIAAPIGLALGLRHSENIAKSKALEGYFPEFKDSDE